MSKKIPITAAVSQTPLPESIKIKSNTISGKELDIVDGFAFLEYHENIFSDTIRVNYQFVDTGVNITRGSVKETLPLYNSEDIVFSIVDGNDVRIKVNLVVNENLTVQQTSNASTLLIKCISEEILRNECEEAITNGSYQGVISDHVKNILQNNLKTQKDIDVENGTNYNFNGNRHKALYTLNWLSKHDTPDKKGKSAGFLFFETSEGYKYKSIDFLMKQEPKKSFIFTDSGDFNDKQYDGKILGINFSSQFDAKTKLRSGIVKTELKTFNPRDRKFKNRRKEGKSDDNAGKDFTLFNKKFISCVTRTTFAMEDTGSQNTNGSTKQQIEKNAELNYDINSIKNQAIARYNEIDVQKCTITIAGDFSLHIGDIVHIDIGSLTDRDRVDKFVGGRYLILDLCHRMDSNGVFTKLNLSRDTFKRVGKPK